MSGLHWPWPILGIAPTDDRKTIREAYARLLKALDPDAATEAFMELRDARDAALSGHFLHPPQLADDDTQADDFGLGDPLDGDAAPPPPAPDPEEKPRFTVDYNDEDEQRFQRMVELFTGEGEMAPSQVEELHAHLDALLADERMADLGHYARVETWLAQLLAERYPRGEALFSRIAEHFEWGARAHELGIHPAIPWLFNAHEGHSRARELANPSHSHHREWNELVRGKPAGSLRWRSIDSNRMANLIATIRRDYPWLEREHWQPELVARWEKKVEGGNVSGPNPWVWLVLIASLFTAVARLASPESEASREAAAELARADPDTAIQAFIDRSFPQASADGRTLSSLKSQNDGTYQSLIRGVPNFSAATDVVNDALGAAILRDYYVILDKLPVPLQIKEIGFRLGVLRQIEDNPQRCAEYVRSPRGFPQSPAQTELLSQEYRYHMFSVVHDEYAKVNWSPASHRMVISGELMEDLVKRSGLPDAKLRETLSDKNANNADLCAAYTALYEMVKEIPAEKAEKILPGLI